MKNLEFAFEINWPLQYMVSVMPEIGGAGEAVGLGGGHWQIS